MAEEKSSQDLNHQVIRESMGGKTILVTGGAGFIGREIVRQLASYHPGLLVILDQAETPLQSLEDKLRAEFPTLNFVTRLVNISNANRIRSLFEEYPIQVVYHAAAYKHVTQLENNPLEAVYVNIAGTLNLVHQCQLKGVEKFVMVSTDKAVNPASVMGASKRICEIYLQAIQGEQPQTTQFIITRFGNVIGSPGSVVSIFKKQIQQGGPVTVTHPEVSRYFMSPSEACQLVLQAGAMGKGGEIFVFDMGSPVNILEMAEQLIRQAGYEPYQQIPIVITQLRSGEKLFEELFTNTSACQPTAFQKIWKATEKAPSFSKVSQQIEELMQLADRGEVVAVVEKMKEIIPEYKSSRSASKTIR